MVCPVRFSLLIILSCLSLGIAYPTNDGHDEALLADEPSLDYEYDDIFLPEVTSEAALSEDEQTEPLDDKQSPPLDTEEAADPAPLETEEPAQSDPEEPAPIANEEPPQSDLDYPALSVDEEPVQSDAEETPPETEEPAPSVDDEPAQSGTEEPAPSADEEPAQADPEEPARSDPEETPSETEEPAQSDPEESAPSADEEPEQSDTEGPTPSDLEETTPEEPAVSESEEPTQSEPEESAPAADEEPAQSDPEEPASSDPEETPLEEPAVPKPGEQTHSNYEVPVQSDSEDPAPSEDEVPARDEEPANEGNDDASAGKPPLIDVRMGPETSDADAQISDAVEDTLYYPTGVTQQIVPQVRIVGGEIARNRAEFAYQASFRYRSQDTHFCGATIIDSTHLLTAAHCVVSSSGNVVSAKTLKVVVGDLNKRNPTETTISRDVLNIWAHPEFSTTTFQHDVAVLRVADLGHFTEYVNRVELATTTPADGAMCVVSGWGTTTSGGITSEDLKFVTVPIVDRVTCMKNYESSIMDGMLCAGFMEGEKDACQGDSGGPLVCDGKLAGVVSWGYYCAIKGYPGIYADVAVYADWIREQQGRNEIGEVGEYTPEVKAVSDIVERRDQFPYQASLRYQSTNAHFCGATIIDSTHVVTAAQCVTDYDGKILDPKQLSVVVGDTNLREETPNTKYRTVSAIFSHPEYSSNSFENDVAVIRVSESFGTWDQNINYVNITSQKPSENTSCMLSGWGTSSSGKLPSERLRYSTVPVVSYTTCIGYYENSITGGMMCAGHIEKGRDSCQGDSGGPLVCNNHLAGIVSWSLKCANLGYPGVFTDVSLYKAWIDEQTGRSSAILTQASLYLIMFTILSKIFI